MDKDTSKAKTKWAIPSWFNKLLVGIAIAAIGAVITFGLMKYDSRIRVLTYILDTKNSIMPTEKVGNDGVVISAWGNVIDNLSTVSIAVYNTTDQDYGIRNGVRPRFGSQRVRRHSGQIQF